MAYYGNSFKSNSEDDLDYVDIHGRPIRVIFSEKTGEILIPINEVRQTGFNIYRKNQYNKTLIDDRQLSSEFDLYLLDCAKEYILKNKVIFDEEQILQSINKCKQALINSKNNNSLLNSSTDDFFRNRVIQKKSEDTFEIQIINKPETNLTQKNLHSHNKRFSSSGSDKAASSAKSIEHSPEKSSQFNKSFEGVRNGLQNKENSIESPKQFNNINNSNNNRNEKPQYTLRSPRSNKDELLSNPGSENTSKSRPLKCTATLEKSVTYTVIVSFIEPKGTVAWVQNVEDTEILAKIFDEVHKYASKQSPVIPKEGQIYAALDDNHWYRCKVIKLKPLTVLFIDYGNTVEVDEVRPISDELKQIPQQGIRISFQRATLETDKKINISPLRQFDDGTYFVYIDNKGKQQQRSPQPLMELQLENNTEFECFDMPKPSESLFNGQIVRIDQFVNDKLTIRAKNSSATYRTIREKLSNVNPDPLKNIKLNQIVLYNDNDSFYRVRVETINRDSIQIEFLDCYNEDVVPKTSLFAITEELSKFPLGYIPIKQFTTSMKKPLTAQQEAFIENHIKSRTKFIVELNNNEFDLINENVSLFDELNRLLKPAKRRDIIVLDDLKKTDLKLGVDQYMCSSLVGFNITIIKDLENILNVLSTTVNSELPYEPEENEVCLGLFEDSWFRCVVKSIENNQYHVHFIDYGNVCILKSNELRPIPDNMKHIPILGHQAVFVGLSDKHKTQLNQLIDEGETYEIDIKRCNNGIYEIEIPVIYEQIAG